MTPSFIEFLAAQARAEKIRLSPELDEALAQLDALFEELAPALEVEYHGPGVGVDGRAEVYRLVVRRHAWEQAGAAWSLKICDGTPHGNWRAVWTVQGASRLRKPRILRVLPKFFAGYSQAVSAAGRAATPAGRRLLALARVFR